MIYIITQRDPYFIDSFLYEFDKYKISYQIINLPNFKLGLFYALKKTIQLYGFYGFLKLLLLLPKYKKFYKLGYLEKEIRLNNTDEIKNIFNFIKSNDIVLSLSAPSKLPVELLHHKTIKLNIHCGKLPHYAGMMPIFWQYFNKETHITITFHILDREIDTGNIIFKKKMKLEKTLFLTTVKAKKLSANIFYEYLIKKLKLINSKQRKINKLRKFPTKIEINKLKAHVRFI